MHEGYYEGIVQLRNCTDDSIRLVRRLAKEKMPNMISEEKIVRGGVDFYVKKKSFLRFVASKVQERLGGEVIFSDKIHGIDKLTSKQIFRETVLINLPRLVKKEVVVFDGNVYSVFSVNKTKITLEDLSKKNKVIVDYNKEKLEKIDKKHKTQVTKNTPQLEVLHPTTYDSVPVVNQKKLPVGKNVKVIIFEDRLFLI